jgi:hypothetical protein
VDGVNYYTSVSGMKFLYNGKAEGTVYLFDDEDVLSVDGDGTELIDLANQSTGKDIDADVWVRAVGKIVNESGDNGSATLTVSYDVDGNSTTTITLDETNGTYVAVGTMLKVTTADEGTGVIAQVQLDAEHAAEVKNFGANIGYVSGGESATESFEMPNAEIKLLSAVQFTFDEDDMKVEVDGKAIKSGDYVWIGAEAVDATVVRTAGTTAGILATESMKSGTTFDWDEAVTTAAIKLTAGVKVIFVDADQLASCGWTLRGDEDYPVWTTTTENDDEVFVVPGTVLHVKGASGVETLTITSTNSDHKVANEYTGLTGIDYSSDVTVGVTDITIDVPAQG